MLKKEYSYYPGSFACSSVEGLAPKEESDTMEQNGQCHNLRSKTVLKVLITPRTHHLPTICEAGHRMTLFFIHGIHKRKCKARCDLANTWCKKPAVCACSKHTSYWTNPSICGELTAYLPNVGSLIT